MVPAFLLQGVILWGFCYAGQHELGHWTVFRNRTLNDAVGHLASFLRVYAHSYQRFFLLPITGTPRLPGTTLNCWRRSRGRSGAT